MGKSINKAIEVKEIDFHGAAVIDQNGQEIIITEEMIQDAFEKLEEMTVFPEKVSN